MCSSKQKFVAVILDIETVEGLSPRRLAASGQRKEVSLTGAPNGSQLMQDLGLVSPVATDCSDILVCAEVRKSSYNGGQIKGIFTSTSFLWSRFEQGHFRSAVFLCRGDLTDSRLECPMLKVNLHCLAGFVPTFVDWDDVFRKLLLATGGALVVLNGAELQAALLLGRALSMKECFIRPLQEAFDFTFEICATCQVHHSWNDVVTHAPAKAAGSFCKACARAAFNRGLPGFLQMLCTEAIAHADTAGRECTEQRQKLTNELGFVPDDATLQWFYGMNFQKILNIKHQERGIRAYVALVDASRRLLRQSRIDSRPPSTRDRVKHVFGNESTIAHLAAANAAPDFVGTSIQVLVPIQSTRGVLASTEPDGLKVALLASAFWAIDCAGLYAEKAPGRSMCSVVFVLRDATLTCGLDFLVCVGLESLVSRDSEAQALVRKISAEKTPVCTELRVCYFRSIFEDAFLRCLVVRLSRRSELSAFHLVSLLPDYEQLFGSADTDTAAWRAAVETCFAQCGICGAYGQRREREQIFSCPNGGPRHCFCIPCLQQFYRQTQPQQFRAGVVARLRDGQHTLPMAIQASLPRCCGRDAVGGEIVACEALLHWLTFDFVCPNAAQIVLDLQRREDFVRRGRTRGYTVVECPQADCVGVGYVSELEVRVLETRVQCWICYRTFGHRTAGRAIGRGLAGMGLGAVCIASAGAGFVAGAGVVVLLAAVFCVAQAGGMPIDCSAQVSGMRRCPSCRVIIEKIGGCDHMTCRCGAHFSWTAAS